VKDYLSLLAEIPAKHTGLISEQISRAAVVATDLLRSYGHYLPGDTRIPTYAAVHAHLRQMANRALDGYFGTKEKAPPNALANEIWGEDGDALFSVVVTGLAEDEEVGFTADIDMNLLYTGE
jgi:hypothetical protein